MDIAGKVSLVTGGASGLGHATVSQLLKLGARVVFVDLPSSDGAAVADKLGDMAYFVAADVTDEEQVSTAVDVAAELGELAVVVDSRASDRRSGSSDATDRSHSRRSPRSSTSI